MSIRDYLYRDFHAIVNSAFYSNPKKRKRLEPSLPTAWEETMYTLRVLLQSVTVQIINAFGLSPKWTTWGIGRLRMNICHIVEDVQSSFEGTLNDGTKLGGCSLNKNGVIHKNLEPSSRCDSVLSCSDFGNPGFGEFILQDSIKAACKCLLQGVELKLFRQYDLWVTQYELCLDSVCDTRAEQHSLYSSIKELMTESLKDLYPVVIEEDQSPEPYVQFQKQPGHVVEILKLYCTTQAGGGSVLRFEYAWDCGGNDQPPTNSIYIPLESHHKGSNRIVLCRYEDGKSLEDELLDTLISQGIKALRPVLKRVIKYADFCQKDRAS
jgi:hypothetical protein